MIWRPYFTSWSKRGLSRCGLLDNILCEWWLVRHFFERVWVILCGWGIVLGEWGWMGMSGGRWGWVHCLIMPFNNELLITTCPQFFRPRNVGFLNCKLGWEAEENRDVNWLLSNTYFQHQTYSIILQHFPKKKYISKNKQLTGYNLKMSWEINLDVLLLSK